MKPVSKKDSPLYHDARLWRRTRVPRIAALWHGADIVGFGTPEATIIQEAKSGQADLIVVGARGPSGLASAISHLGGGTAYRVAADADCPVLTIRHA